MSVEGFLKWYRRISRVKSPGNVSNRRKRDHTEKHHRTFVQFEPLRVDSILRMQSEKVRLFLESQIFCLSIAIQVETVIPELKTSPKLSFDTTRQHCFVLNREGGHGYIWEEWTFQSAKVFFGSVIFDWGGELLEFLPEHLCHYLFFW